MSNPNQPPYPGPQGQPGPGPQGYPGQGPQGQPGSYGQPGPQGGYQFPPGQQPPQGSYYQQGAYRQGEPKKRRGKGLIIAGTIVLGISIIVGILLGANIAGSVPGDDEITRVQGTVTVDVDEDGLVLYAPEGLAANCRVLGPEGMTPDTGMGSTSYSFTYDGDLQASFARVGGGDNPAGEYQVACQEDHVIIAPALSIAGILGGVGGILAGVFGGILGVVLLVIGLILRGTSKR